jgi:ADP-ribose pyrophosphatase YjhB (NUDIX family)
VVLARRLLRIRRAPCRDGGARGARETGLDVAVEDYLGTWVDVYADDPGDQDANVINVAYYTATPTSGARERIDPTEVIEIGWFRFDALPDGLAPPGTLEEVLVAATSPERSHRN